MAYSQISNVFNSNEEDNSRLLKDLADRKEFQISTNRTDKISDWGGFTHKKINLILPGLQFSGAQQFIQNFENPDTKYTRILIKWQTGTGKSIAAIGISQRFIQQFRLRNSLGTRAPTVYIISFTSRDNIQEDMLRYPEFGFVSHAEAEKLRILRASASLMGANSDEARSLGIYTGILRRRITDRSRGGYYQFYGYKEFANRIFLITRIGLERGFDIQTLYSSGLNFYENLATAVSERNLTINRVLLDEMKNGLFIADEIHNVYNIQESNNYGIAIQYMLDILGSEAPRAVFMSATPITGSASEIVDLLNLIVPRSELPNGVPLKRSDFFEKITNESYTVSRLLDGALNNISQMAVGRVSFLLDSDVRSYPRRIFVGDDIENIPYLKIIKCPMSPVHLKTLEYERSKTDTNGLSPGSYSLYDMVFPNPLFDPDDANTLGLYQSRETPITLDNASEEWKSIHGVLISKGVEAGVSLGTYVISGSFLEASNLGKYSRKYLNILEATISAIRSGPGKIMVYHHRVRMSGVLLLQEIFKMNGFIDETMAPIDNTICSICAIKRVEHTSEAHVYIPARFIVAHSDIERTVMTRSISNFNSPENLNGYTIRLIIGSKIIREGLNFRGICHQFIASLPTDYPTLLQVFGRVVRRDSHKELPLENREVRISIFVSTRADGKISPELQRYVNKGLEYLVIQDVERMLHINAIDGFLNYGNILTAMHKDSTSVLTASLDALPYKPRIGPYTLQNSKMSTFLAYNHGNREISIIIGICEVLFKARPVWLYADLWKAVKSGSTQNVNYNVDMLDEGNFAVALEKLQNTINPRKVIKAGEYYIMSNVEELDIGSYLRENVTKKKISVDLNNYNNNNSSDKNWNLYLKLFEDTYLVPLATNNIELCLIECSTLFHTTLIKKLITATGKVTIDDKKIIKVYRRFKIVLTLGEVNSRNTKKIFRGATDKKLHDLVGYISINAASLYDFNNSEWYDADIADFKIGRRHNENSILIGFVVSIQENSNINYANTKFKIRPSVHILQSNASERIKNKLNSDARNLERGAVCNTRDRLELFEYDSKLGAEILNNSIKEITPLVIETVDSKNKKVKSTNSICNSIKLKLLALEENSRSHVDGMTEGIRWIYFFNDQPPSISSISTKQ